MSYLRTVTFVSSETSMSTVSTLPVSTVSTVPVNTLSTIPVVTMSVSTLCEVCL